MAKTIMVVDDSKAVRAVIGTTLKMSGYNTLTAEDGRDALNQLQQKNVGPVDLIITDVNMPNLDGPAFIHELRKLAAYASTPICVLTTESEQGRLDQELSTLKRAWITKPVQPAQILKVVGEIIGA
jgi:two-component system, chemotaxis family, chemotaxis protein CheY